MKNRIYEFKLVENDTGRTRTVKAEAFSMQEAISLAYISANRWMREKSKNWNIVSATDRTYDHQQQKIAALSR